MRYSMRVAKVFANKYESGKLLGFADIIFSLTDGGNGCLTIRGFKIFKNEKGSGIQVGLPSKKDDKGEYRPLVSMDFENEDGKAFMNHLTEEVVKAYNSAPAKGEKKQGDAQAQNGGGIGDEDIPF